MYKVTYPFDYLDPNPVIKTFEDWYEAQDWIDMSVNQQANRLIKDYEDHEGRDYTAKERQCVIEHELSLIIIEENDNARL
jgi:hypothetical protein